MENDLVYKYQYYDKGKTLECVMEGLKDDEV